MAANSCIKELTTCPGAIELFPVAAEATSNQYRVRPFLGVTEGMLSDSPVPHGANLAYAYDELNRLNTVTDAVGTTAYTYDNVGNLQTVTYPNTVAHSYSPERTRGEPCGFSFQ